MNCLQQETRIDKLDWSQSREFIVYPMQHGRDCSKRLVEFPLPNEFIGKVTFKIKIVCAEKIKVLVNQLQSVAHMHADFRYAFSNVICFLYRVIFLMEVLLVHWH